MFSRDSSPDYASSTHSEKPQPEKKKVGGVRKIIGDPNYAPNKRSSLIPDFDFGITQSLTPVPSRPSSAIGQRSPHQSPPQSAPQTPIEPLKPRVDRISPGHVNSLPSPHSRPSSRQMWQPGLATAPRSPGGLTAEDFVQQRAAMARLPGGYVPRRTLSSNKAGEIKTPSPDQSRAQLQKRHSSRPSSRGSLLDFSSTLSAREQEHVARMTGGPLLTLGDQSPTPDPSVGLIGAISAREQDRRNMKEGISSHLVQATIAQRQQQAQTLYLQQVQAQHRSAGNVWAQPQSPYAAPSGYFPQQQYQQQQQQQFYQYPVQQDLYGQYQYQYQHQYPHPNQTNNQVYHEYYASNPGYRRK